MATFTLKLQQHKGRLNIILMCWLNFKGATPLNVIVQGVVKRNPELRDKYLMQGKGGTSNIKHEGDQGWHNFIINYLSGFQPCHTLALYLSQGFVSLRPGLKP